MQPDQGSSINFRQWTTGTAPISPHLPHHPYLPVITAVIWQARCVLHLLPIAIARHPPVATDLGLQLRMRLQRVLAIVLAPLLVTGHVLPLAIATVLDLLPHTDVVGLGMIALLVLGLLSTVELMRSVPVARRFSLETSLMALRNVTLLDSLSVLADFARSMSLSIATLTATKGTSDKLFHY